MGIYNSKRYRSKQQAEAIAIFAELQPWDVTNIWGSGSVLNLYLQPKRSSRNKCAGWFCQPVQQQVKHS